jgi:hypothetical protein
MTDKDSVAITELSDAELDTVAAGSYQVAWYNAAVAVQTNYQLNAAALNVFNYQGGSQTNNNNAGNQR